MTEEERELRRADREWNEAYPRRDVAALGRVIADDWLCIDSAGSVIDKEQLLERVASGAQVLDTHLFDETSVRLFGGAAVVTGRLTASGHDREGGFSFRQRYTRVYARRGGRWQAVATQVTLIS